MPVTILKLLSPYLMRLAANKIVEFLNQRREQRLAAAQGDEDGSPEPDRASSVAETAGSGQAMWFAVSGVVVGTALGYALSHLSHRNR
ncbi:MAG: hypothetical protein R3264_19285 [Anaerolineae bacterium]|nr:hypothetical protein [Anaerolineae bacterium]